VSAPARASFDLAGRTALVTGGTSGLGAAIAAGLADAGAEVVAAGLGADAARPHVRVRAAELDVTDGGAVEELVGGLARLDVVVACAGMIRRGDEHDPEVFARVLDVNLTGTMRTFAACRAALAASGGVAIATASMLTFIGGALVPGYASSKGGVGQLVKSLAAAWAADGIRVNAIAPGWIRTPLTSGLQEDAARSDAILARTPLGRWGEPEDVVGPVLFLCSDAARFVTGAILPVDGGFLTT
jgi:NAD(P)-dependent dehydrogenase (short-subunit alcohol dehydrogenase family)